MGAQSNKFDLILTDVNMPVMGGIEASKQIREAFSLESGLVIMAVTGDDPALIREECEEAGINEIIEKPMSSEKI